MPNKKPQNSIIQRASDLRLGIPFRRHFLGGLPNLILTFVPNPFSGMHPNDVLRYAESFRAKLEKPCKCQTKNLKNSDTSDTSDTSIFAIFGVKNGDFQNLLKDSKTRANLLFDSGIICGMEPKPCKCQKKNSKLDHLARFDFGDFYCFLRFLGPKMVIFKIC